MKLGIPTAPAAAAAGLAMAGTLGALLPATAVAQQEETAAAAPLAVITLPAAAPAPVASATAPRPEVIEEVIVTAGYREQRNQDVVGSTQVFGGRDLDERGAKGLQDYLLEVPSVSFEQSGNGSQKISMRGISNVNASDLGYAGGSPTTGVYLNDVGVQGSGVMPDLDIYDLQRVEVLKGPQGTLYGEGSMGGAIRMISNAPDFSRWQLRTQGSVAVTEDGGPSRDLRAAVNIPLVDEQLAARIVGNVRHTGGFVDYTGLDRKDANAVNHQTARGLLRYQPLERLQLDYTFMYDHENRQQFPVVDAGEQDALRNSRTEDQYARTRFTIHSLSARWNFDFAQLTSVSALYNTDRDSRRRTPVLQNILETQFIGTGISPPDIFKSADTKVLTELRSFSQEFRLVSSEGERLSWIAGAFLRGRSQSFDEQKYENSVPEAPPNLFTGVLAGFNPLQTLQEDGKGEEQFRQIALYGEANYKLMQDLELTLGLRGFKERVAIHFDTQFYGIEAFLLATDPANIDADGGVRKHFAQSLDTSGLLPKLSLSWHLRPEKMLYATVSRGFRSGAPNIYAALDSGPPLIQPDYVWNKELGAKLSWLGGRLITNAAIYHIDWTQLQGTVVGTANLGAVPTQFAHLDNAGDAVVYGAEGSLIWATPLTGLQLALNAGYNHGRINKPAANSQVVKNSETPSTPALTGSASLLYNRDLPWWSLNGNAMLGYTYTDRQQVAFQVEGFTKYEIGAYGLLRAQLGASREAWNLNLYGDNLQNRHAIVGISAPIAQYTVITPRTIGLRLSYEF